jgi:hypothetical protein
MCVCVCVRMFVFMCVFMYVRVRVRAHVCVGLCVLCLYRIKDVSKHRNIDHVIGRIGRQMDGHR